MAGDDEPSIAPIRDIRGVARPSSQSTKVDENVAKHFPTGARLQVVVTHGGSKWTETFRINLLLQDQSPHSLFLKVAVGDVGREIVHGEYESVLALSKFSPGFVPEPVAWGTYASDPNIHFYLASFVDMVNELPDKVQFCETLAKLHKDSMGHCPKGEMFGFHVDTRCGWLKQDMAWTADWEEYFDRAMRYAFEDEERVNGEWKEMEEYKKVYFEKVIPRLLRPLQADGRRIEPVLLHNDLWLGNMGRKIGSNAPIVYDPASMWGHHEFELRGFANPIFRVGREWMEEYYKHFPISEPQEDYEDRYNLYSNKGYLSVSTLHPGDPQSRVEALEQIRKLVEKYKDAEILPKTN